MTEKKEHPNAWALREIADGAPLSDFECKFGPWAGWGSASEWGGWALAPENWDVRRKQKMHRIGEHTFPAPMSEEPEIGSRYFLSTNMGVIRHTWDSTAWDNVRLKSGAIHASEEAAEAHSKALAAVARGVPV